MEKDVGFDHQSRVRTENHANLRFDSQTEFNLFHVKNAILAGKWQVLIITLLFFAISVIYSLSLPNVYKSTVTLSPNFQEQPVGGLGGLAGQLGGLGALAGLDIGAGSDKTDFALEVLKSRKFLYSFIEELNLKVMLIGLKAWNEETEEFIYDHDKYDQENELWVRNVKKPKLPEPSLLETHKVFVEEHLFFKHDKKTGMVSLAVSHFSPVFAQEVTSELVKALNEEIKRQDLEEARKSIFFLENEIENTQLADMRAMYFKLIERHQQTVMLAKIRDDYVFKVVDPAVIAEEKYKPNRVLICLLGTVLGGILSVFIVILRNMNESKQ